MNGLSFTAKKLKGFIKITLACFLVFAACLNSFAQYKGAPVKKDRLVKALRSKQLQTRDIVAVINSNGVDFTLTPETRQLLIAAGARPEVIRAIADNPRFDANRATAKNRKPTRKENNLPANYEDLLDQAMFSFNDQKNSQNAARLLETAVRLNPKKPEAYQLLGFVNLYGLNNPAAAEKLMREAITNGGSAVFRVYHDDSGSFNGRCTGSLYISPEAIRFESDDNRHTFETSSVNIDKLRLDRESNKLWKKYPVFKIFLRIGEEDVKFRFAPISGRESESAMVERFVYISKNKIDVSSNARLYNP
jgi:hypothetical protein